MPASRIKPIAIATLAVALGGGLGGAPAMAQSGDARDASFLPPAETTTTAPTATSPAAPAAPAYTSGTATVTLPEPTPIPAPAPSPTPSLSAPPAAITAPAAAAPAATPVAAVPAPVPAPATLPIVQTKPVEKSGLGDIDPQSIGLLDSNDGGLGAAMWKGTSRSTIERLLPVLSLPLSSPARNNLAQRFLLTTAGMPAAAKNSKQNTVALRLERLIALGAVKDAWKLVQLAKPDQIDDITLRMVVESALATNVGDVCTKLPELMKNRTAPEWQQSLVVCQLLAKDNKAAELSLDLARTQGLKDDTFFTLAEKNVINAGKQLPRQMTPVKPLNIALAQMSALPLPGEVYSHPPAALIPLLVQSKARDDKARLLLAERAAAQGVVSAPELGAVYKALTFDPAQLASPNAAGNLDATHTRALLYQSALQEKSPQARINDAVRFIQITETSLLNGSAAPLLAEMLDGIAPGAEYALSICWPTNQMTRWIGYASRTRRGRPRLPSPLKFPACGQLLFSPALKRIASLHPI